MPERRPAAPAQPSTALTIPDDIRRDLLRVQASAITTNQRLPRIKILPAAAGLYEFDDDTTREFNGVILGHHARNVLWDRPYGEQQQDPEDSGPGCRSPDGITGIPRVGFTHAALQRPAIDTDRINCDTCPYNQFGSAPMVGKQGQGKAVTNQSSIFILLPGRNVPYELTITGTTLPLFDEYLMALITRNMPVQSVQTIFKQERKEKRGLRWAVATFAQGPELTNDEFQMVMDHRRRFMTSILPAAQQSFAPETVPEPVRSEQELSNDGTIPF